MHWLAIIGAHWPLAALTVLVIALCVFAPAVAAAALRWLLGTEVGRYLLLAAIVIAVGAWAWEARFSAGRAFERAEQAAAADRAKVAVALATLDAYMAGAQASAAIGATREQAHAKALAARDRTIADLRTGTLQLRDHWAYAVPADPAAGSGAGSDDAAERRNEGSGDLVQVADTADADQLACQAQVRLYQEIGVLRVDVDGQHASRPRD